MSTTLGEKNRLLTQMFLLIIFIILVIAFRGWSVLFCIGGLHGRLGGVNPTTNNNDDNISIPPPSYRIKYHFPYRGRSIPHKPFNMGPIWSVE